VRRAWWATAVFFAVNGAVYGSIFPRLPEIVERYRLSPTGLGFVLFVPVFTSLIGSALGGRTVVKFGVRVTARVAVAFLALALGLAVATPYVAGLVAALAVLGMADGVMDVGMNMHAVDLEKRAAGTILQGLHAAWTAGAFTAAAVSGIVAGAVPLAIHVGTAAGLLGLIGVVLPSWWAPVRTPTVAPVDGSARTLGILAVVAVGIALAESVPIDWASIYLAEVFGAEPGLAAAATATALLGMFVGRVFGDRVIGRVGSRRTLIIFALLAGSGAVLLTLSPSSGLAFVALGLTGMGSSVLFPGIVSIAGRVSDDGIATVTASSRIGFMIAPVIAGTVAEQIGFRPIMLIPAVAAAGVALWVRSSIRVTGPGQPSV
jgi:MFS family permease